MRKSALNCSKRIKYIISTRYSYGHIGTLRTRNFLSYAILTQILTVRCWCVIKGDQLNVCRRRLSTLPSPAAFAQALRAGVDPSVLAQRNREQRTARDLLIITSILLRYETNTRCFTTACVVDECAQNAHTGLVVYRHHNELRLGKIRIHINHLIDSNHIIDL